MKYAATHYAKAFAALVRDAKTDAAKEQLVKRFAELIRRNGDTGKAQKIVAEAQILIRRASGHSLWEVETARPPKRTAAQLLATVAEPADRITESVVPSLIAGIRITKNGEQRIDATLYHRLESLFRR